MYWILLHVYVCCMLYTMVLLSSPVTIHHLVTRTVRCLNIFIWNDQVTFLITSLSLAKPWSWSNTNQALINKWKSCRSLSAIMIESNHKIPHHTAQHNYYTKWCQLPSKIKTRLLGWLSKNMTLPRGHRSSWALSQSWPPALDHKGRPGLGNWICKVCWH